MVSLDALFLVLQRSSPTTSFIFDLALLEGNDHYIDRDVGDLRETRRSLVPERHYEVPGALAESLVLCPQSLRPRHTVLHPAPVVLQLLERDN